MVTLQFSQILSYPFQTMRKHFGTLILHIIIHLRSAEIQGVNQLDITTSII